MSQYTQSGQSDAAHAGEKAKTRSLMFGVLGLFVVGIVFGPLAISQASKAEQHGTKATAGKVLGWIATLFGIVAIALFLINIM